MNEATNTTNAARVAGRTHVDASDYIAYTPSGTVKNGIRNYYRGIIIARGDMGVSGPDMSIVEEIMEALTW